MNKKAKITIYDVYDAKLNEKRYILKVGKEEKLNTASAAEMTQFLLGFTESAGSIILNNSNYRER